MLSTLLRTIPAVNLDVIAADCAMPPQTRAKSPGSITLWAINLAFFVFVAFFLAFFLGAALMPPATGRVASLYGCPLC
jgi:hypothetical protein